MKAELSMPGLAELKRLIDEAYRQTYELRETVCRIESMRIELELRLNQKEGNASEEMTLGLNGKQIASETIGFLTDFEATRDTS